MKIYSKATKRLVHTHPLPPIDRRNNIKQKTRYHNNYYNFISRIKIIHFCDTLHNQPDIVMCIWEQSQIPHPASQIPGPRSRIPHLRSQIPDPRSQIPDPRSRIPDPRSQIPDPRSHIPDPTSQIPDPRSYIPDPRSYIPDPRSQILHRHSETKWEQVGTSVFCIQ